MSRKVIASPDAPAAFGPYSQAIEIDGFVFCSGSLGADPATGDLLEGIENQTERSLLNIEAILASIGMTMGDVVKCTVFLSDLANFDKMNAVYKTHVVAPPPARSTVQVAALPHAALVEIEAIARRSN
jgi:2-iminobutanoate/2-iminopropanoate deaminase